MNETMIKFSDYLKSKGNSKIYLNPISIFCLYCESHAINYLEITSEDLSKFLSNLLEQGYEKSYINNFVKAIRFFYGFLNNYRLISNPNVMSDVNKTSQMKEEKKIRYFIKQSKMDDLIRNAITFGYRMNPHKMKAILYFMYFAGTRKEELLNLKRQDIDLIKNVAILRKTKGGVQRKVYFNQEVSDLVKYYFGMEEQYENAFNLTLKRLHLLFDYMKKFDKKITPHAMRHSFAQDMLRRGIDIRIIKELLGHKNILTTMIYCNPDEETVEQIYRQKVK